MKKIYPFCRRAVVSSTGTVRDIVRALGGRAYLMQEITMSAGTDPQASRFEYNGKTLTLAELEKELGIKMHRMSVIGR